MSAPSEAERLWRRAHEAICPATWPDGHLAHDRCLGHHEHLDAAVRAAFEEGRWHQAEIDVDGPGVPLPPWLPGAKEDK